jgi:lipoprotein-anchoring transpeptidase ErfK/SrfK
MPGRKRLKNIGSGVQIALVLAIVVLLVAAVGAYALDTSNEDQIADGVSIGGIDVGGQSADEAEKVVRRDIVEPLKHPVHVTFEKEQYTLTPEDLKVRADIDGMVDEAVDASRDGGLFSRVWRYASGGEVDTDIDPRINYSNDALQGFLEGVAANVNREPQDASIDPTPTNLTPVPAQAGITVRAEELRDRVEAALQSPRSRAVKAPVEKVEPEVTVSELESQYPSYITIDRGSFTLRLFRDLKLAQEYTIAVGQVGYDTTGGLYDIQSKQVNPTWYVPDEEWAGDLAGTTVPPGPDNPLQARWMGFNGGAGIHGTSDIGSLGSAASHGCIRMAVPDVVNLYDQVDVGTPVYIF